MRDIASPLRIAANKLLQKEGWLRFVEIPTSAGTIRLVQSERNTAGNGFMWQASSLAIELPKEDAAGSLGRMRIVVPNVRQLAMAYVEVDNELLGAVATVWIQHEGALETFDPNLAWVHKVLNCEMTEKQAQFNCEHSAQLVQAPGPLFDRQTFPQLLSSGGGRR